MVSTAQRGSATRRTSIVPGLAVAAVLGGLAFAAGQSVPLVGGPVLGVLAGVTINRFGRRAPLAPGVQVAGRQLLPIAIVILGTQLSLQQAAHVGLDSLPVTLTTLTVCLGVAVVLGRRLGIGRDLRTLIGVGTGICGASAIAAVTPVLAARRSDVAYALSTIFLFNIVAVLTFPLLGHALGLSQHAFGVFAGTAVNDTSSVVATATTYGSSAANTAVVVKLARSLMIIPISVGLAGILRRRADPEAGRVRLIPWFLLGFVATAAVNSFGLIPQGAHGALLTAASFLITVALTGIGMSTDVAALRRAGARPLILGLLLWLAVLATSLGAQAVL